MAESFEKRVTDSDVRYNRLNLNKNEAYAAIVSNLSSRKKEILVKGEQYVEIPAADANTGKLHFVGLKDMGYSYFMNGVKEIGILVAGKTVVFRWNKNNDSLEIYY